MGRSAREAGLRRRSIGRLNLSPHEAYMRITLGDFGAQNARSLVDAVGRGDDREGVFIIYDIKINVYCFIP